VQRLKRLWPGIVYALFLIALVTPGVSAENKPPDTLVLKVEGAKLPPVRFSHTTHTRDAGRDCVVCHHKDKDPKDPGKCETCHMLKEVKEGAPPLRDAFHGKCQACHKEVSAKGISAPTKCNDCHKK